MKKKFFVIAFLLIISLFGITKINAMEVCDESCSPNILNTQDLVITNGKIGMNKAISIKGDSNYSIIASGLIYTVETDYEFFIKFYNESMEEIREESMLWCIDYYPYISYVSFTSPNNSKYMLISSFEIPIETSLDEVRKYMNIIETDDKFSIIKTFNRFYPFVNKDSYQRVEKDSSYYVLTKSTLPLSIDNIKKLLIANDNIDLDVTKNIILDKDDYTSNASKPGKYNVSFKCTDSKSNEGTINLLVLVVDTTGPNVSFNTDLYKLYMSNISINSTFDVFNDICIDNDGDPYTITLKNNEVLKNLFVCGTYVWNYQLEDSNLNITNLSVNVEVIDDLAPDFYMTNYIINQSTVETLTHNQLVSHINTYLKEQGIDPKNVEVVKNDYSGNESKEGNYNVRFTYETNDNKKVNDRLVINVMEGIESTKIDEKPSLKSKVSKIAVTVIISASLFTACFIIIRKKIKRM